MDEIPTLADLLDLQEVDSAIDQLLDERQSLPELEQYKAAHSLSEERSRELETLEGRHRELSLQVDKTEGELVIAEEKLAQQEKRLFAGGMSARETDHMRMEVESLRAQKARKEDEILDLLDIRESVEASLDAARSALTEAKTAEQTLETAIAEAWRKIDAEVARREARKAEIVPTIDEDLLDLYTKLRNSRGGVVVGRLDGRTCGACHMELSASEHHQVLQQHPPRCIHCPAILVP